MNIKQIFNFYSRSKIIYKMIIGSLIFIIPIGVLLNFTLQGFNYHIDFAEEELVGIQMLGPVQNLLHQISRHNFVKDQLKDAHKKERKESMESEKNQLHQKIESHFDQLSQLSDTHSSMLGFEGQDENATKFSHLEPKKILERWKNAQLEIKAPKENEKKKTEQNLGLEDLENFDMESIEKEEKKKAAAGEDVGPIQMEEDKTLPHLMALLDRIGNKSQLLHDPDINAYHSMDTSLLIMPKFHLRLNDIKSKSIEALKNRNNKDVREKLKQLIYEFQSDLERINANNPKVYKNYDKEISAIFQNLDTISGSRRRINREKFEAEMEKAIDASFKFWAEIIDDLKYKIEVRKGSNERKQTVAVLVSLITFALALGMGILISFGISTPLKRITVISEDIAEGKIGTAREKLDQFKQNQSNLETSTNELHKLILSIDAMTSNIDSLLTQVTKSSAQVTASATQIGGSARQLEATVAEQASSTNEVAAMSKEISKTSNSLSKTMETVTDMAVTASDEAKAGNDKLSSIQKTMETLLSASDEIAEKLQIIRQKTDNINHVITTVTKVANQTNLLSLNAAIEAEKAGEYGIGFSVVAREIRRLADQTAVATLDIEDLITDMKTAVNDGAGSVEKFSSQVKSDSQNINLISENLSGIIEKTSDLRPEFEEVYEGMQLQNQNSDQINETMDQLNEVATHTRDSAIEFKKATDVLNGAIKELQDEVTKFLVGE